MKREKRRKLWGGGEGGEEGGRGEDGREELCAQAFPRVDPFTYGKAYIIFYLS